MYYNNKIPLNGFNQSDYKSLLNSNISVALKESQALRFDSAEDSSIFFAREVDYVKAKSYDVEYPELTALTNFPISNEVDPGAESVTHYGYEKTGMAKIINNYATDLPRADTKGISYTAKIKSLGSSYGYSVQEMRASRMAGKSLDVAKAEAARYAIEALNNKIAWAGDPENGIMGILSDDNDIPLYTIPANGISSSTKWKDKTAAQILADINGMQAKVAQNTKNVERPDVLILPSDVFIDISTRQIDNTGYTIKRFVLENAPYLKEIVPASELNSDSPINPYGSPNVDSGNEQAVALLFKRDPRKITIENPLPFYQYPLQTRGLEIIIPCEARTAGVIIYYPLSLLLALGV